MLQSGFDITPERKALKIAILIDRMRCASPYLPLFPICSGIRKKSKDCWRRFFKRHISLNL